MFSGSRFWIMFSDSLEHFFVKSILYLQKLKFQNSVAGTIWGISFFHFSQRNLKFLSCRLSVERFIAQPLSNSGGTFTSSVSQGTLRCLEMLVNIYFSQHVMRGNHTENNVKCNLKFVWIMFFFLSRSIKLILFQFNFTQRVHGRFKLKR